MTQAAAPFLPRVVVEWPDAGTRWRRVAGALLFVDISGFTAMSERLTVLGREGAERVTEIIDEAFAALLRDAYRQGAGLLKFGGDALLLLFEGEGAAARAARSAHDMRATLRRVGRIPTPAGTVTLQMSSGVHTGEIDLFLVGESHRELLVTGPHATAVVDAEGSAGAGNIVVSAAAAADLPGHLLGDRTDGGFLLRGTPEVGDPQEPEANEPRSDLWDYLPTAIRSHLQHDGRDTAEHRRTAVAFIHFDETDALVADSPEQASSALDELVSVVQRAADENEVCFLSTDIDHDGGKLILTSGAPLTHEDDIDRLLLTVRAIVDAGTTLPVRIGVHAGPLLAAEVGPFYRRFYTVMGDVVNTAARVMSRAGAREILVTDEALDRADIPFQTEAIPPFAVKGKEEPLRASRLGSQLHGADRGQDETTIFVDRLTEITELQRRLDLARGGAGQVVEIVGAAGIGKTQLVRELITRNPQVEDETLVLFGHRSTQRNAYAPVQAAIRNVVGIATNADPAELRDVLTAAIAAVALDRPDERIRNLGIALGFARAAPGDADDPGTFRRMLADTIQGLIELRFPNGVVLVVENAQWIDEPSLALVKELTTTAGPRPWLIVSTRRSVDDDEEPRGVLGADEINLEELSAEDAAALAVAVTDNALLPAEARTLVERTGGNPLFVREVAEMIAIGGADLDDAPTSFGAIFAAKLDRLDPNTRAAVRSLSVLGLEFAAENAAAILGCTPEEAVALADEHRDVLRTNQGRIRFHDVALQDAAYHGLSYRKRRSLHREVGERLEAQVDDPDVQAETLSMHFFEAGDVERTWHYGVIAGRRAKDKLAYAEAANYFRKALSGVSQLDLPDEELSDAWTSLGLLTWYQGRVQDAIDPLARARRHCPDALAEAQLCIHEGELRRSLGKQTAAVRWFRRGRRVLEGAAVTKETDVKRGVLLIGEGTVRFDQGRSTDAKALFEEALALLERWNEPEQTAHACLWLCQAKLRLNEPGVRQLGERALDLYTRTGRVPSIAQARNLVGSIAEQQGDWDAAVEHMVAARRALDEIGRQVGSAIVTNNIGMLRLYQGRGDDAVAALRASRDVLRTVGHVYAPVVDAALACALELTGVEAEDAYDLSLAEAAAAGLDGVMDDLRVLWAMSAGRNGRLETVEARLHDVPTPMSPKVSVQVARMSAWVALRRDDVEGADKLIAWALDLADDLGQPAEVAFCHAVAAEVAQRLQRDPRPHLDVATPMLERLGVVEAASWPPR